MTKAGEIHSLQANANRRIQRIKKSFHMSAEALQCEVERLIEVCEQLDALASAHPSVAEALLGIAGNLRNSATLLELLMVTKFSN